MATPKDQQLAWVRAVMAYLGVSANELAKRGRFAPSTIQRPLSDPSWPNMLSGKTIAAIAEAAGLQPLEFPPRSGGLSEVEAEPFQYEQRSDAIESNADRAVRELCRGRAGRDPWVIRSNQLELEGILPGDIVIVDQNMLPRPRDVVCAQVYQWQMMKAETVFRIYEPPYLMTHSTRGIDKPLLIDNDAVVIKGVVDGLVRRRQ